MKSYTDLEQSKALAKILPIESADMYYPYDLDSRKILNIPVVKDDYCMPCIHCWSLAALLGVLPKIQGFTPTISLYYNYITYPHRDDLYTNADNLVDACYKMIIRLHELNLLWL